MYVSYNKVGMGRKKSYSRPTQIWKMYLRFWKMSFRFHQNASRCYNPYLSRTNSIYLLAVPYLSIAIYQSLFGQPFHFIVYNTAYSQVTFYTPVYRLEKSHEACKMYYSENSRYLKPVHVIFPENLRITDIQYN